MLLLKFILRLDLAQNLKQDLDFCTERVKKCPFCYLRTILHKDTYEKYWNLYL